MESPQRLLAAVDVGAGSGAKLGLFDVGPDGTGPLILADAHVPVAIYGDTPETMADALAGAFRALLAKTPEAPHGVDAVGIACPGLFRSDGTAITVANLGFLSGASLSALLASASGAPRVSRTTRTRGGWPSGLSRARNCCIGSSEAGGAGRGSRPRGA